MSRPALPSRALHRLFFALATASAIGGLAYLMSAMWRGLLTWDGALSAWLGFLILAALYAAIGWAVLARWRRKQAALRAYEALITAVVERADAPPRAG